MLIKVVVDKQSLFSEEDLDFCVIVARVTGYSETDDSACWVLNSEGISLADFGMYKTKGLALFFDKQQQKFSLWAEWEGHTGQNDFCSDIVVQSVAEVHRYPELPSCVK